VDKRQAEHLTATEVVERWQQLFSIPLLVSRYLQGTTTTQAECVAAEKVLTLWRTRLSDISWFMRGLNEHLARRANEEDNCTGRFWEGRFTSQALLDEAAVLTCMSYVDLNPIRAKMANTPEESEFTSIQQRIQESLGQPQISKNSPSLMPLVNARGDTHANTIGFTTHDYLQLVDWAGRAVRDDKRGAMASELPPILFRLGLEPDGVVNHLRGHKGKPHSLVLGHVQKIRDTAQQLGQSFIKGMREARLLYST
jgi:REP element-mobilizing transposase RayT